MINHTHHHTYQHERLREHYAIELDDVLVIEGSHGVGLLDEETLHLLVATQSLDGHCNLHNITFMYLL